MAPVVLVSPLQHGPPSTHPLPSKGLARWPWGRPEAGTLESPPSAALRQGSHRAGAVAQWLWEVRTISPGVRRILLTGFSFSSSMKIGISMGIFFQIYILKSTVVDTQQ